VFWLGDFNYRIDLSNDDVRRKIREKNFHPLTQADQVTLFFPCGWKSVRRHFSFFLPSS